MLDWDRTKRKLYFNLGFGVSVTGSNGKMVPLCQMLANWIKDDQQFYSDAERSRVAKPKVFWLSFSLN